jgi:hypothetical protein
MFQGSVEVIEPFKYKQKGEHEENKTSARKYTAGKKIEEYVTY